MSLRSYLRLHSGHTVTGQKKKATRDVIFLSFNVDCKTIPSAQNETQTYFPQKEWQQNCIQQG